MKCIVCHRDTNSNTHMTIELDNKTYDVHLCEEHADNTTMAQIRSTLQEIIGKIRNMIEIAHDIGINVEELIPATASASKPAQKTVSEPAMTEAITEPAITEPAITEPAMTEPVMTEPAMTRPKRPARTVGEDDAPPSLAEVNEIMKVEEVKTGKGTVAIQKHSEGGAGVTDIVIVQTTDAMIQNRLKELKEQGEQNIKQDSYQGACTACSGSGIHPITKEICPKCGGSGILARGQYGMLSQ